MELKVEEFIKFRNLIYEKAGLFFEVKKIYLVHKRLENRVTDLGLPDFSEYLNRLKFQDRSGEEMQNLINQLTTNETYFFRESNQLRVFAGECLGEVRDRKLKSGDRSLRIWSAGCSSGEEPYTLAIMLLESLKDRLLWNIEIVGTDIDTEVLAKARTAVYSERSVKDVSPDLLKKYFSPSPAGFALQPVARTMVTFRHLNLFESIQMRQMRNFDFIFCRNVLIYFDDMSRKTVVAGFYDSLHSGGFIYLGHAESVGRINTAFTLRRLGDLIVHQKPEM